MKKKDLVTLILCAAGGILFALGMCMVLLPEWEAAAQGALVGAAGLLILLAMLLIRRKMDGRTAIDVSGRAVATALFGVFATAVFGIGMCMTIW